MKKIIFLSTFIGFLFAKNSAIPLPENTFWEFGESLPKMVVEKVQNYVKNDEIDILQTDKNLTYNKVILSLAYGFNNTQNGQNFTDNLTTILNQNLINSNKFIVKNSIPKNNFTNLNYFLQKDGLDYLVSFELKNFENFSDINKITSQKQQNFKGEINYKILSKNEIVFSDILEFDLKTNSQKIALQNLAKILNQKIINAIFPLKILAKTDDKYLISSNLENVNELEIFELKDEFFENEKSLGFSKTSVAKAKFYKNIGNFALIEITEGKANIGNLVEILDGDGKESLVTKIPQGGVILPFD